MYSMFHLKLFSRSCPVNLFGLANTRYDSWKIVRETVLSWSPLTISGRVAFPCVAESYSGHVGGIRCYVRLTLSDRVGQEGPSSNDCLHI